MPAAQIAEPSLIFQQVAQTGHKLLVGGLPRWDMWGISKLSELARQSQPWSAPFVGAIHLGFDPEKQGCVPVWGPPVKGTVMRSHAIGAHVRRAARQLIQAVASQGLVKQVAMAAIAVGAIGAVSAHATPLAPGGYVVGLPSNVETGTAIATVGGNFSIPGADATGTYSETVYREADGDLTFAYSLSNSLSSDGVVFRLSGSNFTGFTTDVSTVVLGSLPYYETAQETLRSADGSTVSFYTDLDNGVTSNTMLVATDATSYAAGTIQICGFNFSDPCITVGGLAPSVPEPASIAAGALGSALLAAWGIKRRNSGQRMIAAIKA